MEIGVNINETIQSNPTPPEGIAQKAKHSLRPPIGKTNGVAFTETAPFVLPALDILAGNNSQEAKTKKEKLKHAANFTSEYFDRRGAGEICMRSLFFPFPSFNSFSLLYFSYFELHVLLTLSLCRLHRIQSISRRSKTHIYLPMLRSQQSFKQQ
jgi:hypothetical protein